MAVVVAVMVPLVEQNISQQNQFYGMGATNPNTIANQSSNYLASAMMNAQGGV